MEKLKKYKVELELIAPACAEMEDIYEYISSMARDSDVAAINDVFAFGSIDIIDEGEITVEEWNGDPVDEIALEDL